MNSTRDKQKRLQHEWSQEFVAEKLGITKSAYSNMEALKRKPSYEVLVKLESYLTFLIGTCCNKSLLKTF